MFKFFCASLLSFFCFELFAQRAAGEAVQFSKQPIAQIFSSLDTLYPPALDTECGSPDKYRLYPANNGGFVSGSNGYNDLEKGQFFEGKTGFVRELKVLFGAKTDNGGFIRARVYGNNSGSPGTLFGISEPLNIAEIDTSGNLSTFVFNNPVPVLNGFFILVDVNPGNNNRVGIVTTQDPCSPSFAWEKWSNSLFYPYTSGQGWNLRIDHVFYVVFNETQVSVDELIQNEEFKWFHQNENLQISGNEIIRQIEVFDFSGRKILNLFPNQFNFSINRLQLPHFAIIRINGKHNLKYINY